MDINRYNKLRKKVKERDFEIKNRSLDAWLFKSTFIGNIGSIFFAFFLVFPALEEAITTNLTDGHIGIVLAIGVTVLMLGLFEYIKRIILSNLSLDIVKSKWKVFSVTIAWWFLLSIAIVGGSIYLSVVGAKKFSNTSKKRNVVVEYNMQAQIDSITKVVNKRKIVLIETNDELLQNNSDLRSKITETPLNFRAVRKEYQDIIDANIKVISDNENRLSSLDSILQTKIYAFDVEKENIINENVKEETDNIVLFIVISSAIEFIIIFGIWFREYYDYNVFLLSESKLESIHKKRKNYKVLLQFVYKNGILGQDELVMSMIRLKEMVKQQSIVVSPNKLVDDFFRDCVYMGIFKVVGKKKYTSLSYTDAIKKIDNFDDTVRVLENLS